MASRRPAKDQPASFDWTPENKAWCDAQMKKYPAGRQASCVIPFLWRGQKQEGWISIPMMEHVARQLEMPYIRVYEVATFYTMFNLAPAGEFHVQVCGTTPCICARRASASSAPNITCRRTASSRGSKSNVSAPAPMRP